jgi:hypothetical protein
MSILWKLSKDSLSNVSIMKPINSLTPRYFLKMRTLTISQIMKPINSLTPRYFLKMRTLTISQIMKPPRDP